MRANHSDQQLCKTYSVNLPTDQKRKNSDTISYASLNFDSTPGLHYVIPNPTTMVNHRRRPSIRRLTQTDLLANGVIINGSLFDGQLFQPRTSYILDYSETPKDANRFIEGHHQENNDTHLDPHLFKIAFILTLSDWHVDRELLLDYCPQDEQKADMVEEMSFYKKFCFPELNTREKNGGTLIHDTATYVFTRTNSTGQVEYGYCRRITYDKQLTKFPIVICIVSTYSYFKLYDAILNELATAYVSNEVECSLLIQSFYSKPMPISALNASGIVCKLNHRRIFFYVCPYDDRLHHDYFSTLLSSLSPHYIVQLFESMLRSKKILCFSNSLSKLTKCCLALSFLIYPFMWPYPFVSLMPSSWFHDLIESPCPYIYGCLYETRHLIPSTMEKDYIYVDLDLNTIEIDLNDGFILPLDLRQTFHMSLEYLTRFRLVKSNPILTNIAVSEACLRIFTELFYRLPDFFKRHSIIPKSDEVGGHFSTCLSYFKRDDSGIDLQSVVSNDPPIEPVKSEYSKEETRLGYDFRSDEFLILQPSSAYVTFLNDFIHGMIFLKFLDDYQRMEHCYSLFNQRLSERRRMPFDDLSINPVVRFRQTFDLLEKQLKYSSKSSNQFLPKLVKKFFE